MTDALAFARRAPSAGRIRGYEAFRIAEQFGNVRAPEYLVVCANAEKYAKYGARGRELYSIQDATIYAAYVQLILEEMGLSSCWVGAFQEGKVKRHLERTGVATADWRPIAILAVGYRSV